MGSKVPPYEEYVLLRRTDVKHEEQDTKDHEDYRVGSRFETRIWTARPSRLVKSLTASLRFCKMHI